MKNKYDLEAGDVFVVTYLDAACETTVLKVQRNTSTDVRYYSIIKHPRYGPEKIILNPSDSYRFKDFVFLNSKEEEESEIEATKPRRRRITLPEINEELSWFDRFKRFMVT